MTLQEFIQQLPHGQYPEFRRRVKVAMVEAGLDISDQTFRNWENGIYEPSDQKKEVINAVAMELTGQSIY